MIVCCKVEVSASGWSLVHKSPTECDREVSILSRPWPTIGLLRQMTEKGKVCYDRLLYRVHVYVSRLTFVLIVGDEWNLVLHTLSAWVRFSPRSNSLLVNKFSSEYDAFIKYGKFMLVINKFTFITSVWQWSSANCFGVGGSFC